jgi:Leucine-rich repeat (LRR) protein
VFNDVETDHLKEFVHLQTVDLGGNRFNFLSVCLLVLILFFFVSRIPFEKLSYLPALRELHLQCNGISNIDLSSFEMQQSKLSSSSLNLPSKPVRLSCFKQLSILDLSYNHVTASSLLQLGGLPSLSVLSLACNDLLELPSDLSVFTSLRKLSLRKNRLGSYQPLPYSSRENGSQSQRSTLSNESIDPILKSSRRSRSQIVQALAKPHQSEPPRNLTAVNPTMANPVSLVNTVRSSSASSTIFVSLASVLFIL